MKKNSPVSTPSRWSAISPPGTTSSRSRTPVNAEFIKKWKAFTKNPKRVTNDPMEAHVIGFNMWVKAVEKAKSTDPDKVIDALPGIEAPNLTGGMSKMLPNHHITKPVLIGEIRGDGQFDVVWKTDGSGARRRLVAITCRVRRTSRPTGSSSSAATTTPSRRSAAARRPDASPRRLTRREAADSAASVRLPPRPMPGNHQRCAPFLRPLRGDRSGRSACSSRCVDRGAQPVPTRTRWPRFTADSFTDTDRGHRRRRRAAAIRRRRRPSSRRCRDGRLFFSADRQEGLSSRTNPTQAVRCRDRRSRRRCAARRSRRRSGSTIGCAAQW